MPPSIDESTLLGLRSLVKTIHDSGVSRPVALYTIDSIIDQVYSKPTEKTDEQVTTDRLTSDQSLAWSKLNSFLKMSADQAPVFVLKGFAGTGKSYLMKMLLTLPYNFVFSAPTNKASKVLSDFLDQQVKTTYSVLGLRMTAEEDKLVLKSHVNAPDLGSSPILVIDEAGMVPKFMADMLRRACAEQDWRIIFVGDPAQWNPIGESTSAVWGMAPPEHRAMLREVKRFDNELLALSTTIRDKLKNKDYHIRIKDNNSAGNGIFVCSKYEFTQKIKALRLEDWAQTKVTAWRNSTVDEYNRVIRKSLGFTAEFEPNDLVLMGAPLVSDGSIMAHTDEELKVISVESRLFNFPEGLLDSYVIAVFDRPYTLFVPKNPGVLESMLSKRAAIASTSTGVSRAKAWASFWDLKNTFQSLRYGYAMTTHRMQGSTVDHILVDQQDILSNPNKRESFRGLYVAATRPRLTLTTY